MSFNSSRSVRLLLVAAAAFAAGSVPGTAVAGTTAPDATHVTTDYDGVLQEAQRLAADGSLVHARSLLFQLMGSYKLELSDAQRRSAYSLEQEIDAKLAGMDRFEVALETARLGLATDDLLTAETKARSVAASAPAAQQAEANRLLHAIADRRVELAPAAPLAVDRAVAAFEAGDFSAAKRDLDRVVRLGVALDRERQAALDATRAGLTEVELNRGSTIPAALTLLGPVQGEWLLTAADNELPTQPATPPAQPDEIEQAKIFNAKSLLGEADTAFADRNMRSALDKYQRVLTDYRAYLSAEEVARAERNQTQAQVSLNTQGGPETNLLDDVTGTRELQRQQIRATYDNLMQQTQAAIASGNFSTARTRNAQARVTVTNQNVLNAAELEQKLNEIEAMISAINEAEEARRLEEVMATAEEIRIDQAQALAQQQSNRDRQILEAIDRVRALQMEMQYDEALQIVEDQILFLDPQNPIGLLLRDMMVQGSMERRLMDINRLRSIGLAENQLDNMEASIPPKDIMEYPENWPSISDTRIGGLASGESEENRVTLAALDDSRITVDFNDNPLSDVFNFVEANAGVEIDADWNSLEDIGIDRDMPVRLSLRSGAAATTVLNRVLQQVSDPALPADWAVIDGIVVIGSDDVLRRNTSLQSYDIRDLLFEVPNFNNAPDFELQTSTGTGGGGQSPFGGGGGDEEERIPREERVDNLIQVIQNNVDPDGWIDLGGSTGAIQELSGVLIITQTPKSHRQINSLLNMLRDVRSIQINVEARFLLVQQNFFEQIGFDLDVYFTDNNAFGLAQAIDPTVTGDDFFDDNGNLIPIFNGGGQFNIDTDGDGVADAVGPINQNQFAPNTVGDEFSVIRAAQNSFSLTEQLASGSAFASNFIGAGINPALGVTGRFLDDIQVDFLVEATQADQRSVTLTAPRLTFTNGQRAWVAVTTDEAYVSDLQPIASDGSAAFDPTISIATSGVVLDIEGVVSADRRYVTMTVITGTAIVDLTGTIDVQAVAGATTGQGTGGDSNAITSSVQTPTTEQSILNTTVTVPDQGTVLLGGQRIVNELEVETGVPVLSKIPILSRFFSNRIDTKEEQTLLILIRPQILIQDEEEERNFPGLLDQLGLD